MKKNKFSVWIGAGLILLFVLNFNLILLGILYKNTFYTVSGILLSLFQFWLHDNLARKSSVLLNMPYTAYLRDIFRFLPSKILDWILPPSIPAPLNNEQKKIIASRAKNEGIGRLITNKLSVPFDGGYECVLLSHKPVKVKENTLYTEIGGDNCSTPYQLNLLNIGSFDNEIKDYNKAAFAIGSAAKHRACALNTGDLGITPDLVRSGCDLIWRISHFDPVCKNADGSFNEVAFQKTAMRPYVRMIELPITSENLHLTGKTLSFYHTLYFLDKLKFLSGGKPIGIRLNNPGDKIIECIFNTMCLTGIYLDFITIEDKGYRTNGRNDINTGYSLSLAVTRQAVDSYKLSTKVIASADLVTEFDILRMVALGAHACTTFRPFVTALSYKAGFWNKDSISGKAAVGNFHKNTLRATVKLMEACAYQTLDEVNASDFYHRVSGTELKKLKDLYIQNSNAPMPNPMFNFMN